jgi:hypothetical protein
VSYADDMIDQMLMEEGMRYSYMLSRMPIIEAYAETIPFHTLLKEVQTILNNSSADFRKGFEGQRAQDILQKGIIYQKLSHKQKLRLAEFIDTHGS